MAIVWMTAWDTPIEAAEFADAMPSTLPEAHIERRDDRVLVLLGAPDPETLATRVWARTAAARPRT
jgi:hypothetical protein